MSHEQIFRQDMLQANISIYLTLNIEKNLAKCNFSSCSASLMNFQGLCRLLLCFDFEWSEQGPLLEKRSTTKTFDSFFETAHSTLKNAQSEEEKLQNEQADQRAIPKTHEISYSFTTTVLDFPFIFLRFV